MKLVRALRQSQKLRNVKKRSREAGNLPVRKTNKWVKKTVKNNGT